MKQMKIQPPKRNSNLTISDPQQGEITRPINPVFAFFGNLLSKKEIMLLEIVNMVNGNHQAKMHTRKVVSRKGYLRVLFCFVFSYGQ
jgi:hypothetical protein